MQFVNPAKLHVNSTIPLKTSKNHKLTKEEKKLNREISKRRMEIEHINRYIKCFATETSGRNSLFAPL